MKYGKDAPGPKNPAYLLKHNELLDSFRDLRCLRYREGIIENRKAITIGVTATYLSAWSVDVSYTNFFGAGKYNLLNDRDFFSATIKYSF